MRNRLIGGFVVVVLIGAVFWASLVEWAANETITLVENGFDLRSGSEHVELTVRYEGQMVRIIEKNDSG